MKKYLFCSIISITLFATSCKKKDNIDTPPPADSTSTASKLDLFRDSLYLYTKEVYLWHEVIPSYAVFAPRQYIGANELEAAQNEMAGIRALQPQDNRHHYSFVISAEGSNAIQTGQDKDFGFFIKAASIDKVLPNDSVYWFVEYVYKNSPSGFAGVQRGWHISKINNVNIGYDNASIAILNDVFFGTNTNSAAFEFTKDDGSKADVTLTKGTFTANSVLYTNVITAGARKTGYIVFNQFFGAGSRTELTNAFNDFATQGINELVVDLRYNHGGSTETQDALANIIAPASATGQTMYTYIYNDSLQAGNFPLLKRKFTLSSTSFLRSANTIQYKKAGSINVSRVFFIVSRETASASELLINNLRPYLDVKLVGDTTYGKPVGFFPIPIYDYAIYPISFKTVNSAGSAEYYDGFAPDKLTPDGINKNWGDVTEPSLASALRYISTGSFTGRVANNNIDEQNRKLLIVQKQYEPINSKLSSNKFTGMFVENK
ncbi:MAG: S41 family peptidase [Bacteroidota bacterium]|nr:S41 family peptidase [Bacteroidota bacterium]